MHNAKKGDKFNIIPLYYLLDEDFEFNFEIKKISKDQYDKDMEALERKNKKNK